MKAHEREKKQKYYSISFSKTFFGVALLLGIFFLSLGVMRIYVATLEKRLSRIDSALIALQDDYAQSVYVFAVATKPEIVLESAAQAQKMSMSFRKTAMLQIPSLKGEGIPSEIFLAQERKNIETGENLTPLELAEKAFLEFFVPLASAQNEY